MKLFVIGLEGVGLEEILADETMENLRRVVEIGCYAIFPNPQELDVDQVWSNLSAGLDLSTVEQGIYIWDQLRSLGKRSILINTPPYRDQVVVIANQVESLGDLALENNVKTQDDDGRIYENVLFNTIISAVSEQTWDYFHAVDDHLTRYLIPNAGTVDRSSQLFQLDQNIGKLLELLDDETVLTIIALSSSNEGNGFVLASANNPLRDKIEDAKAEDLLPTLLGLAGYATTGDFQGKSLVTGALQLNDQASLSEEEEALLRERLSGLGYLE